MEHVPTGDTTRDSVGARRRRMRDEARALHPSPSPVTEGFATPEWLDRSFVLPLTEPELTDVPSQPVPHHDDDEPPTVTSSEEPVFVRPPTKDIDFAKVIRRSDLTRTANRSALGSTGLAGVMLIVYLLSASMVVLGMAIAFAVVALVAVGVRLRLATAPIPHL